MFLTQGRIVTFWGIKSNDIMEASWDGATLYLARTLVLIIFWLVRYIERHLHNLRDPKLEGPYASVYIG
jgi:hypothetical protein